MGDHQIDIPFYPQNETGEPDANWVDVYKHAETADRKAFLEKRAHYLEKVGRTLAKIDYLRFIGGNENHIVDATTYTDENPAPEKLRWTLEFIKRALIAFDYHLWTLLAKKQEVIMAKSFFFGGVYGFAIGKGFFGTFAVGLRFWKDPKTNLFTIQPFLLKEQMDPTIIANLGAELAVRVRVFNQPLRADDIADSVMGKSIDFTGHFGRLSLPGGGAFFGGVTLNSLTLGLGSLSAWLIYNGHPVLASFSGTIWAVLEVLSKPSVINSFFTIAPIASPIDRKVVEEKLEHFKQNMQTFVSDMTPFRFRIRACTSLFE